jgi:CTP:molybdopterin cytidylyltransferase MocA
LAAWPSGQGLNKYIRAQAGETLELPWPSEDVLLDLDTPEDYEIVRQRWRNQRAT